MASACAVKHLSRGPLQPVCLRDEPVVAFVCFLLAAWLQCSLVSTPAGQEEKWHHRSTLQQNQDGFPKSKAQPPNPVLLLFDELSRCRRSLPEHVRWHIAGAVHDQSRRYGYDPLFVVAMIMVESTCSPSARGPRGALGLIQVKPATAREIAGEAGVTWSDAAMLSRPSINLRIGLHYLSTLERRLNDPYLALAAYNMGPARISTMRRNEARRTRYVRRVVEHYELLLKRHVSTSLADVVVN
jgi:hypothetical protein